MDKAQPRPLAAGSSAVPEPAQPSLETRVAPEKAASTEIVLMLLTVNEFAALMVRT